MANYKLVYRKLYKSWERITIYVDDDRDAEDLMQAIEASPESELEKLESRSLNITSESLVNGQIRAIDDGAMISDIMKVIHEFYSKDDDGENPNAESMLYKIEEIIDSRNVATLPILEDMEVH